MSDSTSALRIEDRPLWTPIRDALVDFRVVITVLAAGAFIIGHVLRWEHVESGSAATIARVVGSLLIVLGILLRSWAAGHLRKGCDLTIKGPYSLCRHPLYLGSLLLFVGFSLALGWWSYLPAVATVLVAVHFVTTLREEDRLAQKFGGRWQEYVRATPRFIPWRPTQFAAGYWDVRQWLRSREYRAAATALLGLVLMFV